MVDLRKFLIALFWSLVELHTKHNKDFWDFLHLFIVWLPLLGLSSRLIIIPTFPSICHLCFPNSVINAAGSPTLCSYSCFILPLMKSNMDKSGEAFDYIFPLNYFYLHNTPHWQNCSPLLYFYLLFSGCWLGLHGKPGQSSGPFVASMASNRPSYLPRLKQIQQYGFFVHIETCFINWLDI